MSLIMFVLFLPTHLHHSLDSASMGICVLRPGGSLWALSISGYVNMGRLLSPVMLPFLFPFYEKRMVTAAPYWIFGTLLLLLFFLATFSSIGSSHLMEQGIPHAFQASLISGAQVRDPGPPIKWR